MTDQCSGYKDDSSHLNRNSKNQNVMRTKRVYSYKCLWALAQTPQRWLKSKRRGTEEFSHSNAQHKGYSSAHVCKHSSKHQRLKDFSCPAQVKAIFLEACHALWEGGKGAATSWI